MTCLHNDKDIHGIFVVTERAGNEAIVVWVYDWRIQYTVNLHPKIPQRFTLLVVSTHIQPSWSFRNEMLFERNYNVMKWLQSYLDKTTLFIKLILHFASSANLNHLQTGCERLKNLLCLTVSTKRIGSKHEHTFKTEEHLRLSLKVSGWRLTQLKINGASGPVRHSNKEIKTCKTIYPDILLFFTYIREMLDFIMLLHWFSYRCECNFANDCEVCW